mgnify:CR=1 FL=1
MDMQEFFATPLFGRTVGAGLTALAIAAGGLIVALIVRGASLRLIGRRTRKAGEELPRAALFVREMVRKFVFPVIILAALYGAVAVLQLDGNANKIVNAVFVVILSLAIIRFLVSATNELFRRASEKEGSTDLTRIKPLRSIAVFVIWIAGLLFLLDNLGLDITAVVAGLGIGGIAVALAAQALLGDLFSYFVIVFDRPFEIGDFLIFGDILGSVEKIGIKTTRLRSLSGEQITVSNSDLTGSRVRNYKRMEQRRIVFRIGVVYGTAAEHLQLIPTILREAVEAEEFARFDRAHFANYGDWSLNFEVVYYVLSPDYTIYMDIQQGINLAIFDRFAEEGIEFAFPTRTVQLETGGEPAAGRVATAAPGERAGIEPSEPEGTAEEGPLPPV